MLRQRSKTVEKQLVDCDINEQDFGDLHFRFHCKRICLVDLTSRFVDFVFSVLQRRLRSAVKEFTLKLR